MSEALLKQILNEVTGIKSDVAEMKSDLAGVKNEVTEIKNDLAGVKTEVAGMKNDVVSMKSEITNIKEELQETNKRLTRIEKKQNGIFEQTGKLSEYHDQTNARFDQLQTDIEFTYQKTAIHDLKFNRIENLPPQ